MVVNALLRRYDFLFVLEAKVLVFHSIMEPEKAYPDFKEFLQEISRDSSSTMLEGYVFKSNKLCI